MKPEPTQKTAKGHEIPIPKRSEFDRVIKKAANTQVPEEPKRPLRSRSPRRPKK